MNEICEICEKRRSSATRDLHLQKETCTRDQQEINVRTEYDVLCSSQVCEICEICEICQECPTSMRSTKENCTTSMYVLKTTSCVALGYVKYVKYVKYVNSDLYA